MKAIPYTQIVYEFPSTTKKITFLKGKDYGRGCCEKGGEYNIVGSLGRGGQGYTVLCTSPHTEKYEVVIKVTEVPTFKQLPNEHERKEAGQKALHEVAKEFTLGNRCRHPNIAEYYGYGVDTDGDIGLVMEHLKGEDFGTFMRKPPGVDHDFKVLTMLSQFCGAVECMHRNGVLHRDIKPENLIVTDGGWCLKVIDFGIAADMMMNKKKDDLGNWKVVFSSAVGTVMWQPPELRDAEMNGYDHRSDIYGIGMMMFYACTGHEPFKHFEAFA
jgi:eukaryotic-like serine/threonine-protein kinase